MFKFSLLSNVSIRLKILIGFAPVFLLLIYLAYSSYSNFGIFSRNFDDLLETANEQRVFLSIEKDIVELQRNVLVYSYAGYRGVLRKIEFLQSELEGKFESIRPIAEQDDEIYDRFERLLGHYLDYKIGFDDAVQKKAELEDLNANGLQPLIQGKYRILDQLIDDLGRSDDYEATYIVSQIERDLLLADAKINAFERAQDTALIREANHLIDQIQVSSSNLQKERIDESTRKHLSDFVELLERYQVTIDDISRNTSIYSHLFNVVLAGKAAEIDKLSRELDLLVNERSENLSTRINQNVLSEQTRYIGFALAAIAIGLVSALLIATGIAKPVNAMAETLSRLANGEPNVEIPAQQREDEVGKMARSANAFQALAAKVETNREALEHANIELEQLTSASLESQQFLELTMNSVPDLLFVKDSQFRIVESNTAFLSAYPEDIRHSILGTTTLEKYRPDEAEQFLYFDKKALAEGYSETEETILFPDGQRRTLLTKKVRFENADSEQFILGIGRDITEIKQAEIALQESQERYEIAVKGSSAGLWDWNIKTQELFWSPLLKGLIGLEDEGKFISDPGLFRTLLHPDDRLRAMKALSNHLNKKDPFDIECRAKPCDGSFIWLHIRGHAIWDEKGNAIRMAGSASDITMRKFSEELLVEANAELEEFAYRTSHDLRSPIISSIALLDYSHSEIQDGNVTEGLEAVTHAHASLEKLNKLIEDIFQLTIIRNKRETKQIIDIVELIDNSLEKLSNLENFDRLRIDRNCEPGSERLATKKLALTTIIENLVSNAVKYQDLSKGSSYLAINTSVTNNEFVLDVRDNGLGIPKDQRKNLFSMFKRFHPKVSFGSGLGLYLTKKCADSLSASLELLDEEEATYFRVKVPLMPNDSIVSETSSQSQA